MKKTIISVFLAVVALLCCLPAAAQKNRQSRFFYDAGLKFNFDNREYSPSGDGVSETLFGVRFSPEIGLTHSERQSSSNIAIGLDLRRDFGDADKSIASLMEEVRIYGTHSRKLDKSQLLIAAGVFSRELMSESWGPAFFSEKFLWLDPNISGILVHNDWGKGCFELCCDWLGQYGSSFSTREQFLLLSAAHYEFNPALSLGYNTYMMHFACSQETEGVVDNLLAEPWVEVNLLPVPTGKLSEMSVKAGLLFSAQRDRRHGSSFEKAILGEISSTIRYHRLSLCNSFYLGQNIMTLYKNVDDSGYLYADRLYLNDPFFMISNADGKSYGSHDTAEIRWEPRLGERTSLAISAKFHFHNHSYTGCQQVVSLKITL